MPALSAFLAALPVGIVIGLVGGGGSILAVPILVDGLGLPLRPALTVSLAAVALAAGAASIGLLRRGEVELRTALRVSAGGAAGAPAGTWIAGSLSDRSLILSFSVLALGIALLMLLQKEAPAPGPEGAERRPLRAGPLLGIGLVTGILSGTFGVGGGFVLVPALVLATGAVAHQAVRTSIVVIALTSLSGLASHGFQGREIPSGLAAAFAGGALCGQVLGGRLAGRLPARALTRILAVLILIVAAGKLARELGKPEVRSGLGPPRVARAPISTPPRRVEWPGSQATESPLPG